MSDSSRATKRGVYITPYYILNMVRISHKNYHVNKQWRPHIHDFVKRCDGRVLSLGCGRQPYRNSFKDNVEYIGLDVSSEDKSVDVLGDGTRLPFNSDSFNRVLTTQVLEHVSEPMDFFNEIQRVLKVGGEAFISTNQMYPLHEKPHDYFRFTRYGLQHLSDRSGLNVEKVIEEGTLPMRVCSEINYLFDRSPWPISQVAKTSVNLGFFPIAKFNHREEYIVTAMVVSNV